MAILTVGVGQQFGTIAAAVAAAQSGDVIQLQPGTYTNDFPPNVSNLTVEAVGGMAHLVATVPPPNGKAYFVTSGNVTLQNLEVSGVQVADLNGAAVRHEGDGGTLTIENCYFHNNQEGILAPFDDPNGRIILKDSEFAFNGSNGYSHNIYINTVGQVIADNIYCHDVLGYGSDFRSRAYNTVLTNSRIVDLANPDNYTVDLQAGGNAVVTNNVIEKAAGASNPTMLYFGPGAAGFHPNSSLTVTGNTFINDNGSSTYGIGNNSEQAGYTVVANVSDNQNYGVSADRFVFGAANVSGTVVLSAPPPIDTSHPWLANGAPVDDPAIAPAPLTLTSAFQKLAGDTTQLVVIDNAGLNTITGGSGGLVLTGGAADWISTAVGAADTITAGAAAVITSAGNDLITGGAGDTITASGNATVSGSSGRNAYVLNGNVSLASRGADRVTVGGAADATVTASGSVTLTSGGGLVSFAETGKGDDETATINGGAALLSAAAGTKKIAIATQSGTATTVLLGEGQSNVTSLGADTITAGTGAATIAGAGQGNAVLVQGGSGALTLMAGASAVTLLGGSGDSLLVGGSGPLDVIAGSGNMTLSGGTGPEQIVLGSAQAVIQEGSGSGVVQFGAGSATVTSGAGQSLYTFVAGQGGGTDVIDNFAIGTDELVFEGYGGNAIQSQSVAGGSLHLTLQDGTQIVLSNVAQLGPASIVQSG
jgi:hypothetical protein